MKMSEIISELKVNKITDMVCDLNEQELIDVVLFCSHRHRVKNLIIEMEKENEERIRLSREGKKKYCPEFKGIFDETHVEKSKRKMDEFMKSIE
jgi:hypothetical protein